MTRLFAVLTSLALASPAAAGAPVVTDASATISGGAYTISVTIRHGDTGWDHYADGWSVRLTDGTEIGYRTLHHPHVEEQPFTRSLSGVRIPDGVNEIVIVPHDSVHDWGAAFPVTLGERPGG